jgi:hypothetical protein
MTKREASETIEHKLPQGVLATVPAGHLGFWERRSPTGELLEEFVERLRVPLEAGANPVMKSVAARGNDNE